MQQTYYGILLLNPENEDEFVPLTKCGVYESPEAVVKVIKSGRYNNDTLLPHGPMAVGSIPIEIAGDIARQVYIKMLLRWRECGPMRRKEYRQLWANRKNLPHNYCQCNPGKIPAAKSLCLTLPQVRQRWKAIEQEMEIARARDLFDATQEGRSGTTTPPEAAENEPEV